MFWTLRHDHDCFVGRCRHLPGPGECRVVQAAELIKPLASRSAADWAVGRDEPPGWDVCIVELISGCEMWIVWRAQCDRLSSIADRISIGLRRTAFRKQLLNRFEHKAHSGAAQLVCLDKETEQLCWLLSSVYLYRTVSVCPLSVIKIRFHVSYIYILLFCAHTLGRHSNDDSTINIVVVIIIIIIINILVPLMWKKFLLQWVSE